MPHKYGETEVPPDPRRVVAVGLSGHDYVLALGVVPVGLIDWYGDQLDFERVARRCPTSSSVSTAA